MARRRRHGKKRRGRGSTDSVSSEQNVISPDTADTEECLQIVVERDIVVNNINMDSRGPLERPNGPGSKSVRNGRPEGEDEDQEAGLRLPEMTDTSMDSVGEPLRDVMDRLNGSLDGEHWQRSEGEEGEGGICTSHDGPPISGPFERTRAVNLQTQVVASCRPPCHLRTSTALPPRVQTLLTRVVGTMTLQGMASRRMFLLAMKMREKQRHQLQGRVPPSP